ncbi:hypothetical protein QCA50_000957 [Cerrena zonata]|uniref:Uncharacterized protein n=1 Tax=Cerrena zonata TaxID=2478898 RepID=A0AAW0GYU8_9APHY
MLGLMHVLNPESCIHITPKAPARCYDLPCGLCPSTSINRNNIEARQSVLDHLVKAEHVSLKTPLFDVQAVVMYFTQYLLDNQEISHWSRATVHARYGDLFGTLPWRTNEPFNKCDIVKIYLVYVATP